MTISPNAQRLHDEYCTARDALSGSVSLPEMAAFKSAAIAFSATEAGQTQMRTDLTQSNAIVGGILTEVLESAPKSIDEDQLTPRGYTMTSHLIKQAKGKGFSLQNLIDTIDAPSTVYESRRYPGQVKHVRDGLCVAVDQKSKHAITVFVDQEFTERRPDQTDADALAYERKRRAATKNRKNSPSGLAG